MISALLMQTYGYSEQLEKYILPQAASAGDPGPGFML